VKSDFRGGGYLSLQNLLFFTKEKGKIIPLMIDQDLEFLFGVSSINTTYYLKSYFHCQPLKYYNKRKQELCPRKVLKAFCNMLI